MVHACCVRCQEVGTATKDEVTQLRTPLDPAVQPGGTHPEQGMEKTLRGWQGRGAAANLAVGIFMQLGMVRLGDSI